MPKIILDTDPGIDDAQAIAFAIAHPDIELLALTTVFGNASVALTTRNALSILSVFGRPDIPVSAGAEVPLEMAPFPAPDFVHGADGIGNIDLPEPSTKALNETAAQTIVRLARAHPSEITLVAIGPLTNIAQAVTLDPELPSLLKELVVMGGTVHQAGNVTPLAEANFINDPHAADIVCAHDWPLSIIGLDVTLQTVLRDHDLATIRESSGKAGQFLWDSSRFYIDFYASRLERAGDLDRACAMHDASALVYTVEPSAFGFISGPARVIHDGVALGQLTIDTQREPYLLPYWSDLPDCRAAIEVDADRVQSLFIETLINFPFS
ncbi:nucleoside hydrolase [Arenicella xantha]|uniref:Inosine-uridine nucleoside N-ribohydrolase n=1 Tax=Arenicella xantha TaxID=644221 RepID=A0A395JQL9_9GAMM|nr:nucleoside hydrolase [Arenicella xantha]RBP52855.1 inosine-uridine nucleoside N-ribohydrolase [Arenicella xantha]